MQEALLYTCERYPVLIVLATQLHLALFYETFGFAAVSDPYDDFAVLHVEMRMKMVCATNIADEDERQP